MRIFIVDNQAVFREGLRFVLSATNDFEVVGEADSLAAAFPVVNVARPDLLVVDLMQTGDGPTTAITELRQRVPRAAIALLTSSAIAQDLIDAVAAGALGYILKSEPAEVILNAFRRVAHGQHYVTPDLEPIFVRLRQARFPPKVLDVLSPRERHVFHLVTEGLETNEIAEQFGVSRKTIETHKCRILKKFGLPSTAALVRFAALQGLMTLKRPAANDVSAAAPAVVGQSYG